MIEKGLLSGILALIILSGTVNAEEINTGDTAWVMISAALVLLMTPAVGLFYGGMVRKKHVLSILSQSFILIGLITLQWVIIGYSLSFAPTIGGLIGNLDWMGLKNVGMMPNSDYAATIPHLAFMIFQAMFAIITPALVIGAFTERMKFSSFILFTLFWATLVYDPICHWIWGVGGWLGKIGVLDFAGGLVVHLSAGISALVLAILIGKRHENNGQADLRPHDVTMTFLGGALLWFGWFGFNAGSALSANGLAVHAFVVTNIGGAAGAISWMLVSWIHSGKPSTLGIVTGGVAGLATITQTAGFISPQAAIVVGALGGAVCYLAVVYVKTYTKIDDSLDVMACHGVGGIIGAISVGIFSKLAINPEGADGVLSGNPILLIKQAIGIISIIVYASFMTILIYKILDVILGMRVSKEEEVIGLDLTQHGEEAYPGMDIPGL